MIDLFLSNNRVAVFLEQRKIQITANTRRAFQLLEASISSASGQIATFWLKDFVNTSLKNILEIFKLKLVKLIYYYEIWDIMITRYKSKCI